MRKSVIFLATLTLFLGSCSFMEKYQIDGEAIIKSDGRIGARIEVVPRHQPTTVE